MEAHAITAVTCTSCGDADGNHVINISDVVFLVGFVFNGTPTPGACNYQYGMGDADGNGIINMSDVVFIIGFVYNGTPIPGDCNYQYGLADFDGNRAINISDAVGLIGYVFNGTPVPHCYGVPPLMVTPSIKPPDKELSSF